MNGRIAKLVGSLIVSAAEEAVNMYQFIKIQYELGKLTEEQVLGFVPRWITEEQAEKIIGKEEA